MSVQDCEGSVSQGIALQKSIKIHSTNLPDPPWGTDKSGVPDIDALMNLMSQPAPSDLPHLLAGTALVALKNSRPWNNDEYQLVSELLEQCQNQSKQTFFSVVKQRRSKKIRGRPKSSRLTRRGWKLQAIGRRIDELISQGMSQPEARTKGEQEFSLSRRAIDLHHAKHVKEMKKVNEPAAREQERVDFAEDYMSIHRGKRQEYRTRGRIFQEAASRLKAAGSVLHVKLTLTGRSSSTGSDPIELSIPPADQDQCEALLARKQSIHGALLHCVSIDYERPVTRREIIVQWPEDTVVQRIVDEAVQMANDVNEYTLL